MRVAVPSVWMPSAKRTLPMGAELESAVTFAVNGTVWPTTEGDRLLVSEISALRRVGLSTLTLTAEDVLARNALVEGEKAAVTECVPGEKVTAVVAIPFVIAA